MSVFVVAILLAQALWFWPTFPGGWFSLFRAADSCGDPSASSCFASSLLLSTLQHLLELSIWRKFDVCFSANASHLSYMPYASICMDVSWHGRNMGHPKLPISNNHREFAMGFMATTKSYQIYDPPEMAELKLIWSATIRHKEKSLSPTQKSWLETLRGRLWKPRMIRASVDTRWYEYIMWIYTSCWGNRVTQVLGNWWKQCTFAVLSWRSLGQYACLHKSDARNKRTKIICSLLFHAVA